MNRIDLKNISPILRINSLLKNKDIINLSYLCPLSNLNKKDIENCEIVLENIRKILFAMNILDELFTEITDFKRHIYILGDGTIFNFIGKKIIYHNIQSIDKSHYLEIISTLGLSYRFNVAKKFNYSDTNIMQLRLNGWGRAYCFTDENIQGYKKLKEDIYEYWYPIILRFKYKYINLVKLCDSLKRPLNTKNIQKLNNIVPIKLVT